MNNEPTPDMFAMVIWALAAAGVITPEQASEAECRMVGAINAGRYNASAAKSRLLQQAAQRTKANRT